jgi:hypothetical protein
MDELIEVVLDYRIDGERVQYTRRLTEAQISDLIVEFDELADDNE